MAGDEGKETSPDWKKDEELEDLFAIYIDRLNRGEKFHPQEIMARHPRIGEELLECLEGYIDSEPASGKDWPLGSLGDYTLRRQIGRGGMGVVYEAWENSMDRRVALKVLPPGVAVDARALHRFVREAKTAGQLSHPNVVSVYGMGLKEQTPFYAMEFVAGETLAQLLDRLKTAGPEAQTPFGKKDEFRYFATLAEVFAAVADGLQHAHSKGIIHRDIKPSNLILDREGRLRILDFGLARLEGQESLTMSGDIVGTPLYMSPEQARRKKIPVDHRTDIYSLGTTLYELIAGRPPFQGKDHQDTLSQIIERDPPEPRSLNPRAPRDLETIVLRCLRKDQADRYGTAEALGQDLRRFVRGDPIEARPQSRWERAARRLARHRLRIAGGAVVLAALAAIGWQAVAWRAGERQRLERTYDDMVLAAAFRLELASLVQNMKAGGPEFWGLGPGSGATISRASHLDPVQDAMRSLEDCRRLLPARPEARYHLARALVLLGREKEAQEILEGLISAKSAFVPAVTLRADVLRRRGAPEAAESLVAEAGRRSSGDWERMWLEIWRDGKAGRLAEVVENYTKLIDLAARGREPFLGSTLLARLGRGRAAFDAKDLVQALKDFNTVESLVPEATLPALLAGVTWFEMGRRDEAEAVFRRLFETTDRKDEVAEAVWGLHEIQWSDHEGALPWAERIAVVSARESRRAYTLWYLGRHREAEDAGRTALEQDPEDFVAYRNLGLVFLMSGNHVEGREVLERGLERFPDSSHLRYALGESYLNGPEHDLDRAISNLERASRLPDAVVTTLSYSLLARCYFQRGDLARSMDMNRKALEIGSREVDVPYFLRANLGEVGSNFLSAGMLPEAIDAFDRAIANPFVRGPFLYMKKGEALAAEGKLEEGLALLRQAQPLLPRLIEPFEMAGRLLELQEKPDDAVREYLGAIAIPSGEGATKVRIARILLSPANRLRPDTLDAAAETLEKAVDGAPGNPWTSISLALALSARRGAGDRERALALLLPLLEGDGKEAALEVRLLEGLERVLAAFAGDTSGGSPLALLPSLPPYRAIDAAIAAGPDPRDTEGIDPIVERFAASSGDGEGQGRLLYLEGSLLARAGLFPQSIEKLEELTSLDPESPEPVLRLAEVLRRGDQSERAAATLRSALKDARGQDRRLWDLWLAVQFVDLARQPGDVLQSLPDGSPASDTGDGHAADVRWLLQRLAAGEAVGIRCGGGDYREPGGKLWGRDRFARGGRPLALWEGDIRGTDTPVPYRAERSFPLEEHGDLSAYGIPLPPGKYRVRLLFAEVSVNLKGLRRFDVVLEGHTVLEDLDLVEKKGFATAVDEVFEVDVTDGMLDVRFIHRPPHDDPKISAIDVVRID